MEENFAFIGLGAMGYALASNVRRKMNANAKLYINDINFAACTRFKDEHSSFGEIKIVSTAREAADDSKVVLSVVPGAEDVKKVYLDEETGIITARKDEQRVLCECSTIDVQSTKEVGEKLQAPGLGTYVDTPVSSEATSPCSSDTPPPRLPTRRTSASKSTLAMIGSPSKFFYLDSLGAGLTAKIANNYLFGTILLATAEVLAIGVAQGLDPKQLYAVIRASTGQSWMCDHVMPIPNVADTWVPSNSGFKPGFKTQMMIKDLGLGIECGKQMGIKPTMAEAAMQVWESASKDERCYDRDGSSIYLHIGGQLPEGHEDKGKKNEHGLWEFI